MKTIKCTGWNLRLIALVIIGIAILGFAGVRIHQAKDLANYEIANNCEWQATGTHYGDDRDYICK